MGERLPGVDSIFLTALDKSSPAERAAYLDEVCGEETPLRRRVERLLDAYPRVANFLESPAFGGSSLCEDHGETDGYGCTLSRGVLGDFRIPREIGCGGMGIVYEAEQISLKRRVALKILPFAAVLNPKQLQRFNNEAQAAAALDHPNIVRVHAVGCERGVHYYAMQYIEGRTLAQVIDELRRLSRRSEGGPKEHTDGRMEGDRDGVSQITG